MIERNELTLFAKIRRVMQTTKADPLYRNSLFLTTSNVFNVLCGFLFWVFAAHLYSIGDVGIAAALIAAINLVLLFSKLGLDNSLIRFFPSHDKSAVFNTCLIVTTIVSVSLGGVYIAGLQYFSPELTFVRNPLYAFVFLFFCVMSAVAWITGYAFIAMRKGAHYFIQTIFQAVRVVVIFPLVILGSFGLFGAVGIGFTLAAIFALVALVHSVRFQLKIDGQFAKHAFTFSFANYLANVLYVGPAYLIPILVLNMLGGAAAAQVYIALTMATVVLIIPTALSIALFVEGSYGEDLRKNLIKAATLSYVLLIPAVIIIYVFGSALLGIFGPAYVEAYTLLKWLLVATVFETVYLLFFSVQNVRMRVRSIVIVNAVGFATVITFSIAFIRSFGSVGVGYAFALSWGLLSVIILAIAKREGWISRTRTF